MAAMPTIPQVTQQARKPAGPEQEAGTQGDQALVSLSKPQLQTDSIVLTPAQASLPVRLDVSVPVRDFRVRNLLALESSHLVESGWSHGDDVPLAAGEVQLAWSEFEVVDTHLAVRITRLA